MGGKKAYHRSFSAKLHLHKNTISSNGTSSSTIATLRRQLKSTAGIEGWLDGVGRSVIQRQSSSQQHLLATDQSCSSCRSSSSSKCKRMTKLHSNVATTKKPTTSTKCMRLACMQVQGDCICNRALLRRWGWSVHPLPVVWRVASCIL